MLTAGSQSVAFISIRLSCQFNPQFLATLSDIWFGGQGDEHTTYRFIRVQKPHQFDLICKVIHVIYFSGAFNLEHQVLIIGCYQVYLFLTTTGKTQPSVSTIF